MPGRLSPVGAGFNLVNTIVGSGILALPYALREAGFYAGLAAMAAVAALSYAALTLLIYSGRRSGLDRFDAASGAALGRAGRGLLAFALLVNSVGSCVSYLIIVGDTGAVVAQQALGARLLTSRAAVMALAAVGCTLPLLFFRTLEPLVRPSVASTACLPLIVAIVAVRGPAYRDRAPPGGPGPGPVPVPAPGPVPTPVLGPSVLPAVGVIAFAYSCTQTAFQSYQTLRAKTLRAWRRAAGLANGLALAIYLAFSVAGYRAFGLRTEPNVLNNFARDDALANVARALLAFSLTLTYPMQFYPIRDLLADALGLAPPPPPHSPPHHRARFCALTVALFAATLAAALAIDDLGFVFKLIGTAASSLLLFGLPGAIYLCLASPYHPSAPKSSSSSPSSSAESASPLLLPPPPAAPASSDDCSSDRSDIAEPLTSLVAVLLLMVGAAVFAIGTWTSVREHIRA
ncbi:hypothetical protein H4R18_004928 [Coemansia javaensis]|uniref:Amino acid transporter transmembrane domain-containing protein n=1 Tax=Coemansia javaensis TaxID=2761396 RepID=A0A9W8H4R3_9FUNG|nr:hypothetical protein H4R18_004928 [Coemansia javaensis]